MEKFVMEKPREQSAIESLAKRISKLEERIAKLEDEIKSKANKVVVYGK